MYKALESSLLKEICNLAARYNEKRSGYHWFLGKNMNLFGANNYIDYSRLEFSDGSQQLPFGTTMKQTQPNAEKTVTHELLYRKANGKPHIYTVSSDGMI